MRVVVGQREAVLVPIFIKSAVALLAVGNRGGQKRKRGQGERGREIIGVSVFRSECGRVSESALGLL